MRFCQIGFPNQMPKPSMCSPRHFAARKWPSSWTMMSRLKMRTTSRMMPMNLRTAKMLPCERVGQYSARGVQQHEPQLCGYRKFVERMQHAQAGDVVEMSVVREHGGVHCGARTRR